MKQTVAQIFDSNMSSRPMISRANKLSVQLPSQNPKDMKSLHKPQADHIDSA
jgi:hypothetical protein